MKRILVTGAGGFVAGSAVLQGLEQCEMHGLSRQARPLDDPRLHWHQVEALDQLTLAQLFDEVRPEAVLHAAAIPHIDYCEANRQEAVRVNVKLTEMLAELAQVYGAKFVFVSTDNVFDGERGLYAEGDEATPINYYGETKVAAEQGVEILLTPWVIARIAIVYGVPVLGTSNSFLLNILPKLNAGETVTVPEEEIRSPIDVATVGRALLECCTGEFTGYVHLAGNQVVNRVELVQGIARVIGARPEQVIANDPTSIPGRAPRPRDVSLSNALARQELATDFCDVEEGMRRVLALQASAGK